jgi:hypothetical protein
MLEAAHRLPDRHRRAHVAGAATTEIAMTERKREKKKSEWMDASDSAAYDPMTQPELEGLSLLGGNSLRDGAVGGVSDPVVEGNAGPHERAGEGIVGGPRRSPEFIPDAGMGDGGLSVSGGVAGGADPGAASQDDAEGGSPRRR